jgi:hypothetical protein
LLPHGVPTARPSRYLRAESFDRRARSRADLVATLKELSFLVRGEDERDETA